MCLRLEKEIDRRGGWYRGPSEDSDGTSGQNGGALPPATGRPSDLQKEEAHADDERRPLLSGSGDSPAPGGGENKTGGGDHRQKSIHFGKLGAAVFVFADSLAACRDAVETLLSSSGEVRKYTDLQKLFQEK